MKDVARSLLALLCAVLVFTGALGHGFASAQAPAAGTMILCTGTGSGEVAVDADGRPTGGGHLCPDCVLAAQALAAPAPMPAPAETLLGALRFAPPSDAIPHALAERPRARGPPRLS